jgi:hypothetical protein
MTNWSYHLQDPIIEKGYNSKEAYNPSNTLDLQTDVLSSDCQILSNNGNLRFEKI